MADLNKKSKLYFCNKVSLENDKNDLDTNYVIDIEDNIKFIKPKLLENLILIDKKSYV
jgi:hypothetical protein